MNRSIPFFGVAFFAAVLVFSCGANTNQIRRMQMIEEGVDSPTTIDELTDAIGKFQKRAEDLVNTDIRLGIWYKILGTRYLDNKMYGKALDNFRTAIEYYPTNQNLFYYVGVCAGYMAKASLDYEATGKPLDRERYYALAESAYLRAIELEPRYERALYGLSVLYIFELDRPADAIPHLELIQTIEKRNFDAMFLLARAYFSTGQGDRSIELYDKIINESKDKDRRSQAEENKAYVLQNLYAPD
ncbi:tetratricopeptide repeat protein [Treponema zuelzerae]|uniref:Tetratricopeptide repeat protein n=1 Tax=Teretinema zuelzerae TaxID=156 RepID=A0AAE3JJR2_9SPIR|nr:tetratricopeptide repeat protein [Teretinema zuelzerae]MBN2811171.1 tetratricopeptide repeat protein [Spirochaetales bacterium]MCD1653249.1 tetratricopeptide repeat protein [Teretinema zuelzerae]